MIVFCDCLDCTNWCDGLCDNRKPGMEAIRIDEDARCTDYVPKPEEEGQNDG